MDEVAVTMHIPAPPERVWELVGDPTRTGEWSPECRRVNWIGGATAPAVDARFHGHNQLGWRRWTTTGRIVRYEPPRALAYDISFFGRPVSRWTYELEPDGTGTKVTERFLDRRDSLFRALGPAARGVSDVATHNAAGMRETLQRVRDACSA